MLTTPSGSTRQCVRGRLTVHCFRQLQHQVTGHCRFRGTPGLDRQRLERVDRARRGANAGIRMNTPVEDLTCNAVDFP